MIATLQFTLPEETREHALAVGAPRLASLLCEMDNQCRTWQKHGHQFADPVDVIGWVRSQITEACDLLEDS